MLKFKKRSDFHAGSQMGSGRTRNTRQTSENLDSLGVGDVDDEVHHLLDGDDAVAVGVGEAQDLLRDPPAAGKSEGVSRAKRRLHHEAKKGYTSEKQKHSLSYLRAISHSFDERGYLSIFQFCDTFLQSRRPPGKFKIPAKG